MANKLFAKHRALCDPLLVDQRDTLRDVRQILEWEIKSDMLDPRTIDEAIAMLRDFKRHTWGDCNAH